MKEDISFLKLIQTARSMPQYGYVISGIKKAELSDLAQHHYLVTLTAWFVGNLVRKNGGRLNLEQVMAISLVHDLGELFGGDIAMPYAKANPKASKLAKQFEQENQAYLTKFLGNHGNINELFKEAREPKSDEGIISKVADYLEVTHYKQYLGQKTAGDVRMVLSRIEKMIERISNARTRKYLTTFVASWTETMSNDDGEELFESAK